jgi:hypothetical protein
LGRRRIGRQIRGVFIMVDFEHRRQIAPTRRFRLYLYDNDFSSLAR